MRRLALLVASTIVAAGTAASLAAEGYANARSIVVLSAALPRKEPTIRAFVQCLQADEVIG